VSIRKTYNSTVTAPDGKTIVPRGVGTKIKGHGPLVDTPIPIKEIHMIPEFAKEILSVSTPN
jgi:hypothetical protein